MTTVGNCESSLIDAELPSTAAYLLDPLSDPRWERFLQRHPQASLFHSTAWLRALAQTYGYEPLAYTTAAPGVELRNGIVMCRVKSFLTGRRLVSLPFSDHCEPLVDSNDDLRLFAAPLEHECQVNRARYLEFRPLQKFDLPIPLHASRIPYAFHKLDLTPDLESIFRSFHKSSTQRKIVRSQREGLTYSEGTSGEFLDAFYELKKKARAKHNLPSQPREWFANLVRAFGENIKIRLALKDDRPIAAMMTIRYKDTLVYKYGGSDPRFNRLGSMHFLFWTAIQEAKAMGLRCLDFGRTDQHQHGLITFKSRWGCTQSSLTYVRYGTSTRSTHIFDLPSRQLKTRLTKFVLSYLGSDTLSILGRLLYRHIA